MGASTVMFGIARIRATSSIDWWVAPSPKSDHPELEPTIFTFTLPMAMPWRTWS